MFTRLITDERTGVGKIERTLCLIANVNWGRRKSVFGLTSIFPTQYQVVSEVISVQAALYLLCPRP